MSDKEFIKLVAQMRNAQREFFKYRGQARQAAAMRFERAVDKYLQEYFENLNYPRFL